jgi:hypothetical protein
MVFILRIIGTLALVVVFIPSTLFLAEFRFAMSLEP